MLSSALRWNVSHGTLKDLEECLLNTLARNVAGDRAVFALTGDLVDLIDIDYAALCKLNVEVCRLNKAEKNILNVLANVTRFCERGSVGNSEGNLKSLCQSLRKVSLTDTGGTEQKNVALLKLDFARGICRLGFLAFLFFVFISPRLSMRL